MSEILRYINNSTISALRTPQFSSNLIKLIHTDGFVVKSFDIIRFFFHIDVRYKMECNRAHLGFFLLKKYQKKVLLIQLSLLQRLSHPFIPADSRPSPLLLSCWDSLKNSFWPHILSHSHLVPKPSYSLLSDFIQYCLFGLYFGPDNLIDYVLGL